MIGLLALAAAAAIRSDGPPVTPAGLRGLPPALVGDMLLGPGHPPIVEVGLGRDGFGPPPPPGQPVRTEVRLYAAAEEDAATGFCRKAALTVTLAPVSGKPLPPARPAAIAARTLYRLPSERGATSRCESVFRAFFAVRDDLGKRSFAIIQALRTVQRNAAAGRQRNDRPALAVDDPMARDMIAYEQSQKKIGRPAAGGAPSEITDPAVALRALPLDTVAWIGPADRLFGSPLDRADLIRPDGGAYQGVAILMGGEWTVGLAMDNDRIVLIRMRRMIPPPF